VRALFPFTIAGKEVKIAGRPFASIGVMEPLGTFLPVARQFDLHSIKTFESTTPSCIS